jgi:hypothetical protein
VLEPGFLLVGVRRISPFLLHLSNDRRWWVLGLSPPSYTATELESISQSQGDQVFGASESRSDFVCVNEVRCPGVGSGAELGIYTSYATPQNLSKRSRAGSALTTPKTRCHEEVEMKTSKGAINIHLGKATHRGWIGLAIRATLHDLRD